MKELFVHIGGVKTGTTAIQSHFSFYDPLHRCLGFHYPRLGESRPRNQDVANDIQTSTGTFATRLRYLQHIEKSGCKRFLISAEKLSALPRGPEYFEAFRQVARVRIVMFVRRQDRYLESLYRQLVKNTREHPIDYGFSTFVKQRMLSADRSFFEWLERMKPWEKMFGKENIIIVPYNEYQRVNSIYVLADLVNLPPTKHLPSLSIKYGNPSLSGETILFLQHMRAEKIQFNPLKLRQFDAMITSPSTSFLAMPERKLLVESFREANEALGQYYGIDVSPLFAFDEAVELKRKLLIPEAVDMAELTQLARKAGLI